MNLALTPEQLTSSIAVIQLGTLVAVIVYFIGDIWNITRAFIHDHLVLLKDGRRDQFNRTNAKRAASPDAWLGWLDNHRFGAGGRDWPRLQKKQIEGTYEKSAGSRR